MKDFAKDLTPIPGRGDVRNIATARRIGALQDAVLFLLENKSQGGSETGTKGIQKSNRRPRFQVWYHTAAKRLYVGEGMVGVANESYPDAVVRPFMPTLNGTALDANPAPFFSDLSAGKSYELLCIHSETAARMELREHDDPPDLNRCERAKLIATMSFQEEGEGLVMVDFLQKWASDISSNRDDVSCDSSASDDSGDSDDSDDSDGDDSDDSDDSDDDSGDSGDDSSDDDGDSNENSSDDDSDDSSDDECCPTVTITQAVAFIASVADGVDTANCFASASVPEPVKVLVSVTVTGNPCECTSAWLKVTVGSTVLGTKYMGFSGVGSYEFEGTLDGYACQTLPVTACWYTPSVGVNTGGVCLGHECCTSSSVTLPEVCGDGGCSENSSDDSSDESSSDDSGDSGGSDGESSDESSGESSDDSSSGDESSDKNCIIRMPDGSLAAMCCFEMPNNQFGYHVEDIPLTGRVTRVPIDERTLFACEPGSLRAVSTETGGPRAAGSRVEGKFLVIRAGWLFRPRMVSVFLIGVKKGADREYDPRTERQYLKNKKFYAELNSDR